MSIGRRWSRWKLIRSICRVSPCVRGHGGAMPDGPMAAHVLGYLGEINQKQLKLLKAQGYALGDEIGQYGLERRWEELLRGQSGGPTGGSRCLGPAHPRASRGQRCSRLYRASHFGSPAPGDGLRSAQGQGRHHRCARCQQRCDPGYG